MLRAGFRFESSSDGMSIQAYRWEAPSPSAVMVIAHGAAEHALRYERFVAALNNAGISAWAMDHRGHGASAGPDGLGDFGPGGWDALVADIGQLIGLAREAHAGLPVALLGHSMGAAAVQQYAPDGSSAIDALILSGSTAREPTRPGETPPPRTDPNAAFEPARTRYEWLSRDTAEVDKYIADPLCGFENRRGAVGGRASAALLADPLRLQRIRSDLPCLFVAGDADPINRHLAGIRLLESQWHAAGVRRIDTLYYEGGRHEMLNEVNRDEVTRDIIVWLRDALRI